MKHLLRSLIAIVLFCGSAMAASQIDATIISESEGMRVIRLHCVSHTDGTFTAATEIALPDGLNYWVGGWVLGHAVALNGAANYPNTAGTVTITNGASHQIVGSTATDTLTLSTSASGQAQLSASRSPAQRPCYDKYYITIGDTQSGTATSVFDIDIVFEK